METKGDSCCNHDEMPGTQADVQKQPDSSSDRGGDFPTTPEASQEKSRDVTGKSHNIARLVTWEWQQYERAAEIQERKICNLVTKATFPSKCELKGGIK